MKVITGYIFPRAVTREKILSQRLCVTAGNIVKFSNKKLHAKTWRTQRQYNQNHRNFWHYKDSSNLFLAALRLCV